MSCRSFIAPIVLSILCLALTAEPKPDKAWLRLLHYDSSGSSRIDHQEFFLAPTGKTDPDAELVATIQAMQDPTRSYGPNKLPAQCAYPARRDYLIKRGLITHPIKCPETDEWVANLGAVSATIVYASAFSKNPASMFGHLILRLNTGETQKASVLLGYGVAFMARTDPDDNPLQYAFRGLTGGYEAFFNNNTYYEIVATYNNSESRDLWELDLDLTPAEIRFLSHHLYELLQFATYDYFFLDENCALQLLALLEAVRPSADLTDNASYFVLPLDSFKDIGASMGQGTIKRRMSLESQAVWRRSLLNQEEFATFEQLVTKQSLQGTPPPNAKILDAVLAHLNYLKFKSGNKLQPEDAQLLRESALTRSQMPVAAPELPESPGDRSPLDSHSASRTIVGIDYRNQEFIPVLGVYSGLHDYLMRQAGYEENSSIDYLGITLRGQNKGVKVSDALLVEIMSVKPFSWLDPQYSFQLGARYSDLFNSAGEMLFRGAGGLTFGDANHGVTMMAGYWAGIASESVYYGHGPSLNLGLRSFPLNEFSVGLWAVRRLDLNQRHQNVTLFTGEANWNFAKNSSFKLESQRLSGSDARRSTALSWIQFF